MKPGHRAGPDTAGMEPEPIENHRSRLMARLSRPRRAAGGLAVIVVMATVLAACGGGTSTKTAAASPPTTSASAGAGTITPTAAQLQAFRTCLTQQGVTLPTFTPRTTTPGQTPPSTGTGSRSGLGGGGGALNAVFSNPADQAAVQACQATLPAGYVAQQQARQNQQAAFNSCMADHGVTVAPTTPGSPPPTLDRSSDAYKTCSPLLPARPQGASAAPATTAPAA